MIGSHFIFYKIKKLYFLYILFKGYLIENNAFECKTNAFKRRILNIYIEYM